MGLAFHPLPQSGLDSARQFRHTEPSNEVHSQGRDARPTGRSKAWRENVVKPVRALRRQLKDGIAPVPVAISDPIRNAVKNIELDAERVQLETLEREFPIESMAVSTLDRQARARANVSVYAANLGGFPERPVASLLAAFAKLDAK